MRTGIKKGMTTGSQTFAGDLSVIVQDKFTHSRNIFLLMYIKIRPYYRMDHCLFLYSKSELIRKNVNITFLDILKIRFEVSPDIS